jgi:serine/threonine-protein kinase
MHVVWPTGQVTPQLPLLQTSPAPQGDPQEWQFCESVLRLVQNALAPDPHRSGFDAGHWQLPLHTWPVAHLLEQLPQLFGSLVVFVQNVGSRVGHAFGCDAEHVCTHDPVEQSWPGLQAVPALPASPAPHPAEAPQCWALVFGSTHAPPQLTRPEPHVAAWHWPPVHVCPVEHVLLHVPQFCGSFIASTHDCPHCMVPPPHACAQAPFEQTMAFVASHVLPHPPQLVGSVFVFVQAAPHCVSGAAQVGPVSAGGAASGGPASGGPASVATSGSSPIHPPTAMPPPMSADAPTAIPTPILRMPSLPIRRDYRRRASRDSPIEARRRSASTVAPTLSRRDIVVVSATPARAPCAQQRRVGSSRPLVAVSYWGTLVKSEMDCVLKAGEVLADKYRIERMIGRGGMAEVYAAYHEILHQTVAVKVLLPEVASTPGATLRFLNEARAAARIRGDHVTAVMDVGALPDGVAYMVLEYLDGEDLEAFATQQGPLPAPQTVDFVLQALEAVAQAHALGIVHRDLKPSNLFLARRMDGSSVVKVLDFGISKSPRSAEGVDGTSTSSQVLLGSPVYMAPEQARSAKSVDQRADIWAIGVVMFRLLSGHLPFVGESLTAVLIAIVELDPPPLRSLEPSVPPGLEGIVMRCLSKDREGRFANVAELALALEPFAGTEAAGAADRICRSLGTTRAGVSVGPTRPLVAADAPPLPTPLPPSAPAASGPKTESAWGKSSADRPRRVRRARVALATGGVIIGVAAIGGGAVTWRSVGQGRENNAVTSASVAAGSRSPISPVVSAPAPTVAAAIPTAVLATPDPTDTPPSSPSASAAAASSLSHGQGARPARPQPTKPTASSATPTPTYDILDHRN